MNIQRLVLAICALILSSQAPALERADAVETSVCVWDTCVPQTKTVDGQELFLRAHAPFRYWGFKVYTAALYAPKEVSAIEAALGSAPMRLEIHYYRSFSAKDFRESGEKVFRQNPEIGVLKFQAQLDEINSFYRRVENGDSYALTFLPDKGLTLLLNDRPLGTVADNQFARGYLGIWLSRYSLSKSLTNALTQGSE